VTLQHNFCEGLQFSFVATKKSHQLETKASNTAIQRAVYASWNLIAEKGHTHRQGTNPEWFMETSETPLKPTLDPAIKVCETSCWLL